MLTIVDMIGLLYHVSKGFTRLKCKTIRFFKQKNKPFN